MSRSLLTYSLSPKARYCLTRIPSMKILVADDDSVTRRVLNAFLVQLKHEPLIIENGRGALDALRQPDAPHIAILDWMMPDMEGPEVCRQLRKLNHEIETYVIMLTGKKEKVEIAEALDAGADDVLSKPFNILEMKARLRVAERQIQRQLKLHALLTEARAVIDGGSGQSQKSNADGTVAADNTHPEPPPSAPRLLAQLTLPRTGELVLDVLREAGVGNAAAAPFTLGEMTRASGFTVWTGFVIAPDQVWLDLILEAEDFSASEFFTQAHGVAPNDNREIMDFLKKIHAAITTAIETELQSASTTTLAPFRPVVTGTCNLRLPEEFRRQKFSTKKFTFTLTLALQPCPLILKKPGQLNALEILAESYPKIVKEEVVLLNQGSVLNERFIAKIVSFDLSAPESQPVPVFQPSPLALDFLVLGLPAKNQR